MRWSVPRHRPHTGPPSKSTEFGALVGVVVRRPRSLTSLDRGSTTPMVWPYERRARRHRQAVAPGYRQLQRARSMA